MGILEMEDLQHIGHDLHLLPRGVAGHTSNI